MVDFMGTVKEKVEAIKQKKREIDEFIKEFWGWI